MTPNIPATLNVLVVAKEHANQDSLPLRYGFYFEKDTWVTVKRTSAPSSNKQEGNIEFDGKISDHDGLFHSGFFVVRECEGGYKLVTSFNKKIKTENELSTVLKYLRQSG